MKYGDPNKSTYDLKAIKDDETQYWSFSDNRQMERMKAKLLKKGFKIYIKANK